MESSRVGRKLGKDNFRIAEWEWEWDGGCRTAISERIKREKVILFSARLGSSCESRGREGCRDRLDFLNEEPAARNKDTDIGMRHGSE